MSLPQDKTACRKLFDDAGFQEYDQWEWHHDFEVKLSDMHNQFLKRLGLTDEEVMEIRVWAKEAYREI